MVDETKIRAKDIMQTEVVTLHCQTPIERAIETFEEYSISGAPVVDEAECLVGVLSATDLVKRDRLHNNEDEFERHAGYYLSDPLEDEALDQEDYDVRVLERETVDDYMTPKIISVDPDATLRDVCATMVRENIHRVFVVERNKLQGVISTFDVVKSLAGPRDGS